MAVPVLSGIGLAITRFVWPWIKGLFGLLRHKLWFFVTLAAVLLGPLQWIGEAILSVLQKLVPEVAHFAKVAQGFDVSEMTGAIAKIGQGAALANCVIAIDAFVSVAIGIGYLVSAFLVGRASIFLYTMLPGKGT